jgi:hypothetical protein
MSAWPQDRLTTIVEIEDIRADLANLIALLDSANASASVRARLDEAVNKLDEALRGLRQ